MTTDRVVRALNEAGIASFRGYLEGLRSGATPSPPFEILDDEKCSGAFPVSATVDATITFSRKFEFGRYLAERLHVVEEKQDIRQDAGLWSWLALCFFDQICPAKTDGTRRLRAEYSYILSQDYKHHYRHLIRTPYLAYRLHGEHARVVLDGPLDRHGEASEQLLSREQILTNTPLFAAMDHLYVRPDGAGGYKLKQGARSKTGGSMRRMGTILRQFDLTYDLRAMTAKQVYDLLPSEFDRFKKSPASG